MKTRLFASALLVVGLGLTGGAMVVSAAPPNDCGPGTATVQQDCLTAQATQPSRVYQYDPDSDAFTWFQFPTQAQANASSIGNRVPALAPELEVQSRVYQYDPDSDAYTWFQFPTQAQAPALISAAPGNSNSVPRDPLFLGDNGD